MSRKLLEIKWLVDKNTTFSGCCLKLNLLSYNGIMLTFGAKIKCQGETQLKILIVTSDCVSGYDNYIINTNKCINSLSSRNMLRIKKNHFKHCRLL